MKNETRFCDDLGLHCTDRSRKVSCKWKSPYCKKWCYNNKIETFFCKHIPGKDIRNERFWEELDGESFKELHSRKRKGNLTRFRFQTRGETFAKPSDVFKVKDIAEKNPKVVFWCPTRAWIDSEMKSLLEDNLIGIKNIRLHASFDPSHTQDQWKDLINSGWSIMYFGDDDLMNVPTLGITPFFKCPKTHLGQKGSCGTCNKGCFDSTQTFVHLKNHAYNNIKRRVA